MCSRAEEVSLTVEEMKELGWFEYMGSMVAYSPPDKEYPEPSMVFVPIRVCDGKPDYCEFDEMGEVDPWAFETIEEYADLMARARLYASSIV
jgi:hypothetical protein